MIGILVHVLIISQCRIISPVDKCSSPDTCDFFSYLTGVVGIIRCFRCFSTSPGYQVSVVLIT